MVTFDASTIHALPLHYAISQDMDRCGLSYYKAKPIKRLPWLVGIARGLDFPGCMTVRKIKGDLDVAVYPDMTLREVINSFTSNDGVASVNCCYFDTLEKAAACLRRTKAS